MSPAHHVLREEQATGPDALQLMGWCLGEPLEEELTGFEATEQIARLGFALWANDLPEGLPLPEPTLVRRRKFFPVFACYLLIRGARSLAYDDGVLDGPLSTFEFDEQQRRLTFGLSDSSRWDEGEWGYLHIEVEPPLDVSWLITDHVHYWKRRRFGIYSPAGLPTDE